MKELTPETIDMVERLASKFQTTSEHVYEVMLRQAHVNAMMNAVGLIFFGALFLLSCASIAVGIRMYYKHQESGYYGNSNHEPWIVLGGAASLLTLIPTILNFGFLLPNLLNPEYMVIREILGVLK
jgi:Ni,Fe-hydrogenase I cytochrome b subunit